MAGNTSKRGFASMDKDKQRAIAAAGGRASTGNFRHDRKRASKLGRIGGQNSHSRKNSSTSTATAAAAA